MNPNVVLLFLFLTMCLVAYAKGTLFKNKQSKPRSISDANVMDVADFSVYYDLKTNETIKQIMPRPWYRPGWPLRFPFNGGTCQCEALQCKCCTGIRIQAFNFDRQTCTVLTFEPNESTLGLEVRMRNATVYSNTFSTRNLPPLCIPIPIPYLPPGLVDMCVRLFDINLMNQKMHVCLDMDTRIDKAPVVILHFDCMDMGLSGIGLSKPGGSQSQISTNMANVTASDTEQLDSDVFDAIADDETTTKKTLFGNSVKYI